MTIDQFVIQERARRGITQDQLAQLAGVGQASMCRLEAAGGARGGFDRMVKILSALDLRVNVIDATGEVVWASGVVEVEQ